jgi:hypothetical protein
MRQDIRPGEIDCVFCWRTSTGGVGEGARDAGYNGKPVRYRPDARRVVEGLHTSVEGRACPHRPTGFRLNDQGCISRMCMFVAGYVDHARLVPASDARKLGLLRGAAHAAVVAGEAREWALAAIHARGRRFMAVHVGAPAAVVADLVACVDAPWTLEVREKQRSGWPRYGAEIVCADPDGRVIATLAGDTLFDQAPLPRHVKGQSLGAERRGPHGT